MTSEIEPQKKGRMAGAPGTLYLAATPIGNLEDMTCRAVRILAEAKLIAAEDTRRTRKLLAHYGIHAHLTSYHEHNKAGKGPKLIQYLLAGHDLVCVSDAGLPGIADPGSDLARLAIAAGIAVSPLPGANAALSALICSGLSTERFTFVGFLPRTAGKRCAILEEIRWHRETLIFYASPHHLREILQDIANALGESRPAAIARELTKRFEEFRRGTLAQLIDWAAENEPRGEFVLVVSGATECPGEEKDAGGEDSPEELVERLVAEGKPRKEAMREAAKRLGVSRREIYRALLAAKGQSAEDHDS